MNLGSRIRSLRKEQNMTQSQLAKPEMTKSMLSQIENGLAMPSMKNLQFIANKLNKPMSYILDDIPSDINSDSENSFDEIIMALRNVDDLIKDSKFKEALDSLDNLQSEISINPNNKLLGDILSKKGICLLNVAEFNEGEKFLKRACDIYMENINYTEAAKSYMKISLRLLRNFDYEECIKIYEQAKEIYSKSPNRDTHFEIELLNNLAKSHSAKGNFDKALEYLNNALDISNTTGIYYKADEIHRLTAILNFYQEDFENFKVNIEKAEQFANFTDSKRTIYLILIYKAIYENNVENYKKALAYLEDIKSRKCDLDHFFYREKSIALYYMEDYKEALANIKLIDDSVSLNYRIDYLILWSSKIYEGLIYSQMNELDKALECILTGIDKMRRFDDSKLLAFALESASKIYYKFGNFEKAYQYLREAKEMSSIIVKNKIYF